ncbi:hypothetical protein ACJMK2_027046 [Sinanodonta woodiana]|uniref:Uncharacterized protein n=1 Tax=Sinanodonta woodiana TaxID=1069815 RepID=A0ABD3XLR5_SINWO
MSINTVCVMLVAFVVGSFFGIDAIHLYKVDTSGKEEVRQPLKAKLMPSLDETLVDTFANVNPAFEDIDVRQGSGSDFPESSEELPLVF